MHVAELVPEVAVLQRGAVSALHRLAPRDRLEHGEVGRVGLVQAGQDAVHRAHVVLLPGVHTIASLAKRWLLGAHQGAVDEAHLASYLDEFVFRFNRRRSRSRGLVFCRVLELAVAHDPVRYRDLIANPRPKATRPSPPGARGHPASLERPPANRPWRAADPPNSA